MVLSLTVSSEQLFIGQIRCEMGHGVDGRTGGVRGKKAAAKDGPGDAVLRRIIPRSAREWSSLGHFFRTGKGAGDDPAHRRAKIAGWRQQTS